MNLDTYILPLEELSSLKYILPSEEVVLDEVQLGLYYPDMASIENYDGYSFIDYDLCIRFNENFMVSFQMIQDYGYPRLYKIKKPNRLEPSKYTRTVYMLDLRGMFDMISELPKVTMNVNFFSLTEKYTQIPMTYDELPITDEDFIFIKKDEQRGFLINPAGKILIVTKHSLC